MHIDINDREGNSAWRRSIHMSGSWLGCAAMQKYLHRGQRWAGREGGADERHYRESEPQVDSFNVQIKSKFEIKDMY